MKKIERDAAPLCQGATADILINTETNYTKPTTNSAGHQRLAILLYLQTSGPLTTLAARHELGICHPAARVMELRKLGRNIITHWRIDHDSAGVAHRVAEYVLLPGSWQEG